MIEHRTVTFNGADVTMTGHPDALDEIQRIVNTNPYVYYGCCANCNRTPTVAGKLDAEGYCPMCQGKKPR